MSLDEPVIPWSDELAYCIAANKAIGEVEKYQESYVCYASTGYMCEASGLSVIRTHGSAQPITARLDIVTAPAEYCLPIKKDRRFAPEFTVQVTLGTSTAANLPAKVLACPFSETHRRSLSGPLRQRLPQFLVNEALGRSQPASAEDRQKWYLSFKGQTTTHLDFDSNRDTVPHTGGSQVVMQKRGTFTGLEYLKSSHMERVYLLFVMTIGDSPDIIATLFSVPTIVICRASQRRLATERLGYPLSVYDDLRSRGCSYNLPSRKPGAMPPSPATPGRAAAAAAAAAVAAASAGVLEGCGAVAAAAPAAMPPGLAPSAAVPLGSGIALLAGSGDRRISGNGGGLSPMALPMRSDVAGRGRIFDLAPQPPEVLAAHNGRAVSAPPAARGCEGRSGSDEEHTQDDREHHASGNITGHKRTSGSGDMAAAGIAGGNAHGGHGLVWLQGPSPLPAGARKPAEDLTAKVARMGNSTPPPAKAEAAPDRSADAQPAALLKALPEKLLQGLLQFYEDQQKGRPVSPQTQMDAMAAWQKLQEAEAAAAAAAAAPAPVAAPAAMQPVTQLRPWRLAPKAEPAAETAAAAQPLQRTAVPLQPSAANAPAAVRGAAARGQQTSPVSDASALSAFAQKRLSSSRAQGTGFRRALPDIIISNANFELPVNSDVLAAHINSPDVLAQIAAATTAAASPSAPRGPTAVRLPNSFAERAVRCALEFFYSGRTTLDPETVLPTLAVASHFESPALVTFCLDYAVEQVTGLLSRWLPAHSAAAAAAAVSATPAALPALSAPLPHSHVGGVGALGLLRVDPGTHPGLADAQFRGTPMSRTPPSGGRRVDTFDAVLERYDPHVSSQAPEAAGARGKVPSAHGFGEGPGMSRVELLLRTYEAARRVSTGGDASGRSNGTAVLPGGLNSPRRALEPSAATARAARRSSGTGDMTPALGQPAQAGAGAQAPSSDAHLNDMHALAEAANAIAANMHGGRAPATPPPMQGAAMLAPALGRCTSGNGGTDGEAAGLLMAAPSEEQTRQALDLIARIIGTQHSTHHGTHHGRAPQAGAPNSKALADSGAALEAARRLMQGDVSTAAAAAATARPSAPSSAAPAADGAPAR